jgi:CheY-like chemotaxis protein
MHPTFPVTMVIIEDDPGHARWIARSLRRAHITKDIVTLHERQEALAYLCPEPRIEEPPNVPYLVYWIEVSLWWMATPVLDRMKRDERTQHIPVIMLSMVDVPAEIERCDALGCNVSMTKPVEETRFIEALRQLGLCMSIVQLPTGLVPVTPH